MEANVKKILDVCASAPDPGTRIKEFLNKLPEGHEVVELFVEFDRQAVVSPAHCLVFFTIVNVSTFADRLIRMSYEQLFTETEPLCHDLVKVWKTIDSLDDEQRTNFLARSSLLLEAACLAWQDARDGGSVSGSQSGSSLLVTLCEGEDVGSQVLSTKADSWPSGIWRKMKEVLEELDFTIQKDRSWSYRIDLDSRSRLVAGANIKAYVKTGASTLSPLALARLSQNLITRFSLLLRTISMYPADHPSIAPALDSFIELLGGFADSEAGMVAITILGGELMLNNVKVKSRTRSTQSFLAHLNERRINSISFQIGLDTDNLFNFIELLNRKAPQIRERGGLNEMCRTRGIQNVSVDEFRYALIARDGKLVSEVVTGAVDSTLEDLIFRELIDRLQKGDSIKDIPTQQLGEALSRILEEAASGSGKYRSMLADFVATLDPTILEKGILVSRELQKTLAWGALRKIIDKNLEDLDSKDQDIILDALDKLNQLACIGAERGKTHTVMHVTDNVRGLLLEGSLAADALFAAIILLGSVCERLISTGRLTSASELVSTISDCRTLPVETPAHASALRRGLSEAFRRIDTPEAADVVLQAFMDSDESRYHAAEKITAEVMFRNLGMRLVDLFLERKREIRARVYSVLRRFGAGYLLMFHNRIDELERGGLSVRDRETGRFVVQDWYILRNLVSLLGDLESERSLPILERLCYDSDDRVRKQALLSLMKVSEKTAVSFAANMIGDPSSEVAAVSVDVLSRAKTPDRGLIPAMLRLMHSLPSARKTLMRFLLKVADDNAVRRHFRGSFSHCRGVPFEEEDLMLDGLAILVKAGQTEEIDALKTYLEKNSGGKLKRASAPESVLKAVTSAVYRIRTAQRTESSPTT
ncbi:MAG: HEAT repeat domain-containing protein [Candidatus Sabulitectum sp.]|nr:HEAT repeat domain-containing protein [Candidatus Sabulitectum sp.]